MKPIYLDYNATTPIAAEVAEAMRPFLDSYFGNPSSVHPFGVQSKKAVEQARMQIAALLRCYPDEIIFTSGGSEANNMAIKGVAFANRQRGRHIITSAIEHPAVIEVCRFLEEQGWRVTYAPVDEYGTISVKAIEEAITPETVLISVMHANNEVGTVQPIAELAELATARGILLHTDAAQSVGKIPVTVDTLGVDLLSIAGHKLYAPKGIGALYCRRGVALEKLIHGASHENNRRAGTENVLEIVGLGKACEIAGRDLQKNMAYLQTLRDQLYTGLRDRLPQLRLNGSPENRLPNTLSISFPNIEANTLLAEISDEVAASAGAACHSDSIEVSGVLTAMQVPLAYAMGTIRFSTGRLTTAAEITHATEIVAAAVTRLGGAGEAPLAPDVLAGEIKLTQFTHGLGCACKLRPQALEAILAKLPPSQDVNVLVGIETSDDAAVYRLDDHTAIVQTVDFFTPIVDDPYHFGAIAAANSLSDIYAMGARPLFALNIVGFPSNRLPMSVLEGILQGAQDKAKEAGISVIGGHTVDDTEPKFGMAVTGIVAPERVIANSGAQPGDALILTKAIGVGIIATAAKRGLADATTVAKAVETMSTLNRRAAEVMAAFSVHACTDITGFGLLGHLLEMARGSGVDAVVEHASVPVFSEVWEFARGGVVPGGTLNNLDFIQKNVEWSKNLSQVTKIVLCDAQTSGGLLIAVPNDQAHALHEALLQTGISAATIIGRFAGKGAGKITVI